MGKDTINMVSVIIPVYNGEQYIPRCLDTLFSLGGSGMEVIAVNDGSRDASSAILHEYASRYPALKVIDQENSGAARARRKGIEAATGDYIGFLDIDDCAEPDMYEKMGEKAMQTGADIVFCDYVTEYPTSSRVVKNRFDQGQTFPLRGVEAMRYMQRRQAIFSFPWNKIYRAELLRSVEFPEGNFVGEDYNMLLQLFEKTDKIEYLELVGYHYAMTDNSASRSGYSESTLRAYRHYQEDYEIVCRLHPDMKRDVTNYLIIEYMACVIAMGRNKTYNRDMIREIKRFVRRGLWGFLTAGYVSLTMKGSAVALLLSYRLLIAVYRLIA